MSDVLAGGERVGVVPVRQQLAGQSQCLGRVAHHAGPARDVVAGGECVGVVAAQHPLLVRQQLAVQPQRLTRIAHLAGPMSDVAAKIQDGRIVLVESLSELGEPLTPAFKILPRAVRVAAVQAREQPLHVAERPQVVGLAEEGVAVEGVISVVFGHRGQGLYGLNHSPVHRAGIDCVAHLSGR